MSATVDIWRRAGRAARDDRKRFLALQGLLWSGPVLVVGSLLARLPEPALAEIGQPVRYVLDPLVRAYAQDRDLALIGYVALQVLLLAHLWGLFGGAIHRLAAVDLAGGPRETGRAALGFAARHWRAFVGARVAIWLGIAAPLAAAALVAMTGRIEGPLGGLLLALSVGVAVLFAIGSVVVASVEALAGFLTAPTVACEDSDAFDAVSRTFSYAGSGLPRLVGLRLLFAARVLIGTAWHAIRTLAVGLLAWGVLRLGAGPETLDRSLAVLGAGGMPGDAERLGIDAGDVLVAAALALAAGSLAILWLADLVSRVICARTAVYLLLRQAVDRVGLGELRTPPRPPRHLSADEAGFVEVGRVEDG